MPLYVGMEFVKALKHVTVDLPRFGFLKFALFDVAKTAN